jgi:5-(carboxyamino)imidazole ribonucleotide synthase
MRVAPGGTIGVIGGGQLARMLAFEAHSMGYRIAVLTPEPSGPAGQVSDICIEGALDDVNAAKDLAHQSDVITIDTEHVPAHVLEQVEAIRPVRPSAQVLRVVQDRLEQRRFLALHKFPQVQHASLSDAEELLVAREVVGFPAILKTRRGGYDGKGQIPVGGPGALAGAWKELGEAPSVLESFVDFEKEVSVLLARSLDGEIRFHPTAENVHRHHILRTTSVPVGVSPELAAQAQEIGAGIATALDHVGMMAIEMFVTREGKLLVNEIAPRVHNSGHYTFGACVTSQFEQHVRAICGLPLGDPSLLRPVVMLNLLGDLWQEGTPDWGTVLAHPNAHLHLYGKETASPGRKMGHVLVLDENIERARSVIESIAADLERK